MKRREALRVAAVTAGAGFLSSIPSAATARNARGATPPLPAAADTVPAADPTTLFHRSWGSGQPMVFVHGWGVDSTFWHNAMLPMVARGVRCITYDRRGCGRSGDPGGGYDYDTLADDLASVLDHYDVRDATLVAHSMGGGDVVRYLTRHGDGRVARVALVGTTLPFLSKTSDNPEGVDRAYFGAWRAQLSNDYPQWIAQNEDPFWAPTTSRAMKDWGRDMALRCSLQAIVESTHAIGETDFRAELAAVSRPTLIVHGALDRSVPVHFARATARLVPRATYLELDDAPHGLPITHAERLVHALSAFVGI